MIFGIKHSVLPFKSQSKIHEKTVNLFLEFLAILQCEDELPSQLCTTPALRHQYASQAQCCRYAIEEQRVTHIR
jgi:hypothetical protein